MHAEAAECELQLDEGAHITGDLNLAGGQGAPGLEVPQLQGDDAADSPADEPDPAAAFCAAGVQADKQLNRAGQRRRGRRVSLREP